MADVAERQESDPIGAARLGLTRALRPIFAQVFVLSSGVNLIALVVPIFVLQVYDRVIVHAGLTTLEGLVAGVFIALLFDQLLRQLRSRLLQRASLLIDAKLGSRVFGKLLALPLAELEARPNAFWQALFRDLETVRNTAGGAIAVLLCDLPFALLFLAVVFVIAEPAAWVLLVALPLFIGLAWWSGRSVRAAGNIEQRATAMRDTLIGDIVAGRATVKALGMAPSLRANWEARHAGAMRAAIERGRRADRFGNISFGLGAAVTVALTTVGALAILDQRLTIGALVAANLLAARVVAPFHQLVGSWRALVGYRQARSRLREVLALPEDRFESEVQFGRPRGDITLEDVAFHYRGAAKPVFAGIHCTFGHPGLHAIVGRNGSGKSTLLKLLLGLYRPTSGRVLIDGSDIAQFGRRDLNEWIGYLPQESVLLQGSVRRNIEAGRSNVPDETLIRAAQLAGVHSMIADMPEGYGSDVGEGGARLSGGQRQRIALARALLGDPPILLLDEPTANLDRRAEQDLRDALATLSRERSIIVVTHSAAILGICQTVSVLDGGRIAAGPAAEMLPRLYTAAAPARSA
ncbi:peptidase domain-containing ABC transporter [Desertibaculum subflavum]|uniref:peptidase domain-containing ABC transporter n=1 Tax=Desertibaculum subflavum TaxID=2268458 RepID=UPI000E671BA5